MLKNILYKKEFGLIAGTMVLLFVCYELAFKETIQAFGVNAQLKTQLNQVSDLSYQPGYLERKARNLDMILNQYQMDSLALRGNTIASIASMVEKTGAKVSEVPVQDPAFNTAHFIIQQLNFEGNYTSLVKALNLLETNGGTGIPRSVILKSIDKRPADEGSEKIVMEVFLEIRK